MLKKLLQKPAIELSNKKTYLNVSIFLMLGFVFDVLTTSIGIGFLGAIETNPLWESIIQNMGFSGLLFIALAIIGALSLFFFCADKIFDNKIWVPVFVRLCIVFLLFFLAIRVNINVAFNILVIFKLLTGFGVF